MTCNLILCGFCVPKESSAAKEENIDGASQYELNKNHAVSAVGGTASRSPKLEKAKAGSHLPITGTHRRKPKSPMKVRI